MKRVLIIKMWALGDILMATPLLHALKRLYLDCEIDWMVDTVHADVLYGNPLITKVIAFDSGAWRTHLKQGRIFRYMTELIAMRQSLKERRYDLVLNLTTDKVWSSYFLLAPRRFGMFYRRPPWPISLLYQHRIVIDEQPRRHNTFDYLGTIKPLIEERGDEEWASPDLEMSIGRTGGGKKYVAELLEGHKKQGSSIAVVAPYSTGDNRNWPDERYVKLCRWLAMELHAFVIVSSAPSNEDRCARLVACAAHANVVAATQTTIEEYKELIAAADVVICVDTSAMHMAAALGTPYVALFGATPVAERKPLVGPGIAISKELWCAPCDSPKCANPIFRECMDLIQMDDVQRAVMSLKHNDREDASYQK